MSDDVGITNISAYSRGLVGYQTPNIDRIAKGDVDGAYRINQEDNVFQYDFAHDFWFGNAGFDDDARLFVHIADDSASADDLVTALLEEHSYEYDEVESDADYRLFRHRYLGTFFVIAQQGRYVFGAEKLADTGAVTTLLARIAESLGNDET